MSLEYNGGHLLRYTGVQNGDGHQYLFTNFQIDDSITWPIRMVRERHVARKTYCATKKLSADLLLDMPNLSNNWSMFIFI